MSEQENDPSIGYNYLNELESLPLDARLDFIADQLAKDTKNKTTNVGIAILALRNEADALRATPEA